MSFSKDVHARLIAQHCTLRDINEELDRYTWKHTPQQLMDYAANSHLNMRGMAKAIALLSTPMKLRYIRKFTEFKVLKLIRKQLGLANRRGYFILKEFEPIVEEHQDWLEPDLAILRYMILNDIEKHQGLPKTTLHLWYPNDVDLILGSLAQDNRLQDFTIRKARRLFSPFQVPLTRWDAQRVVKKHYTPSQFIAMSQLAYSFYLGVNRPYELLKLKQTKLDEYTKGASKYATIEA